MIDLSLADSIVLILYAAALISIGFYSSKKSKGNEEDYLLAGRSLSMSLFVMTTVATWYGGILGVGEFTYRYGVNSWILQGLPYYIFAILFAVFISRKIRASNLLTIPQKIENHYDKKISILISAFIFLIVTPAPYVLMVGIILSLIFEIPLWLSVVIGMLLASIYLYKAGYRSDIYTDVIQFVLMFIGFIVLLYFSIDKLGSFEFLSNNLNKEYLIPFSNIPFGYFLVWFLIGLWTFGDPGFHQRSYAAKNERIALYGLLMSVVLWFVFDFLTTSTGLYAKAYLPNLENPANSFPLFANKILPSFFKGLFFTALLATIISTLNSFTFLSAQTLGKDIIGKFKLAQNIDTILITQICLAITSIISIILVLIIPSVVDLWYSVGSICMPGLLFPIISSYYPKISLNKNLTFVQIIFVSIITAFCFFIKFLYGFNFWGIEPMICGIISGFLFQTIGLLRIKLRE